MSFAFFCLVPAGIVHSDGLVRFPLCARALTPPFELFVNAILSSHGVMRFLLARRESPCNKNSSSNSMVHNKNLFLPVSVQGKSSFARIYRTKRKIGNEGGEIDERRREHDAGYTRSRKMSSILHIGSWGVEWFISETTRNAMNGFMQPRGNARNFQLDPRACVSSNFRAYNGD